MFFYIMLLMRYHSYMGTKLEISPFQRRECRLGLLLLRGRALLLHLQPSHGRRRWRRLSHRAGRRRRGHGLRDRATEAAQAPNQGRARHFPGAEAELWKEVVEAGAELKGDGAQC